MPLTLGVEEEFHLLDAQSGHSTPAAKRVLHALGHEDAVVPELKQSVVETNSDVCTTLGELRENLIDLRRELVEAADSVGVAVAASGTAPLVGEGATASYPKDRYVEMSQRYDPAARDQVVCGVQTQIGIEDRELAVAVLSRAMRWTSVMTAIAASSPYWFGTDTGFASFRTTVWDRWPSAGPPAAFDSAAEYDELVATMIRSETALDVGMIYFDIRLSAHQPTIEFRVCDANPRIDAVVMLAGLWRALASTCIREVETGRGLPPPRVEVLRAARWQAARRGLSDTLLDPVDWSPVPAATAVEHLLNHVSGALESAGDADVVRKGVAEILSRGGSAAEQRAAYDVSGELTDLVRLLVDQTKSAE